jgi:G2/mitotic-specific cyclin-B, other
MRGNS